MNLRFISLVVPVSTLEEKYAGGLGQCIHDLGPINGDSVELADGLFRISAMSPNGMQSYCEYMQAKGLIGIVEVNGTDTWQDFCVVDCLFGPTLPCDWIEMNRETREVFFVGQGTRANG